jgi:hypothetical protein
VSKYNTNRLSETAPRIVGRAPADYAQELQEFLEKLLYKAIGGIPAGFNETDPTIIDGGSPSAPGSESAGWAAADHQHGLDIDGTPGNVATVSAQGAGPGVSLIDHTHRLTILTVKGDLLGHNGSDPIRIPVGADGYVPMADPLAAPGWSWQPSSGGSPSVSVAASGDQADLETRAAFDSLPLRQMIAQSFR